MTTMHDPLANISTRATPQSEPIPGTVPNNAGGHSFQVDDWTRLRRFLILGTEGGSYYTSEQKLTKDNADALLRCIATDGRRVVAEIVAISEEGRAPKQHPTMFALAACTGAPDADTRKAAAGGAGLGEARSTRRSISRSRTSNLPASARSSPSTSPDRWRADRSPAAASPGEADRRRDGLQRVHDRRPLRRRDARRPYVRYPSAMR